MGNIFLMPKALHLHIKCTYYLNVLRVVFGTSCIAVCCWSSVCPHFSFEIWYNFAAYEAVR